MPIKPSKKIWMDGKFVSWKKAKVHVLTHTLHYGGGVFEGIRCDKTSEGPAVFRLKEHVDRLFKSAELFNMKIPFSKKKIFKACIDVVKVNKLVDCYIRPLVYYGYGKMGLNPAGVPVNVSVSAWKWGAYLGKEGIEHGVDVLLTKIPRPYINDSLTQAKVCGYYANSIIAKCEAIEKGYAEAIMLNKEGKVSECSGENIFFVKKGKLITPPEKYILRGITRDSILKLAKDHKLKVTQRMISKKEIFKMDEAFLTGTAAQVTPISHINHRSIGDGEPGPITQLLQEEFFDITQGWIPKYKKWLAMVK